MKEVTKTQPASLKYKEYKVGTGLSQKNLYFTLREGETYENRSIFQLYVLS